MQSGARMDTHVCCIVGCDIGQLLALLAHAKVEAGSELALVAEPSHANDGADAAYGTHACLLVHLCAQHLLHRQCARARGDGESGIDRAHQLSLGSSMLRAQPIQLAGIIVV